ncbi:MAG: PqiC family protein [Pseudomonadota bacterium]
MNTNKHGLLVAVALAALALSGCIMQGEPAPDNQFYVLDSLPADTAPLAPPAAGKPLVIDLAAVRLPQYLQRTQIVTRIDANRLSVSEFDQWGGNLEKNMMRVLGTNLALLLGTPEVHLAARRAPGGVDAQVEVEVMKFERGPDGRAELAAQWRLIDEQEERTLVSRITNLRGQPARAGDSIGTTVAAMSDLLGELSRRIASAILDQRATG